MNKRRGTAAGLILAVLFALLPAAAAAAKDAEDEEIDNGVFVLVNRQTGVSQKTFALKTDVFIKVTGIVIRGRVIQTFKNQGTEWMEGIYMFPLPETAAVDTLRMIVGDRIIEGEIKERGEAKKTYEKAKAEGKKATLLEQARPNIFNAAVANIGPGETIDVLVEYQQTVDFDNGLYSFTFPLTVGPRYIPLSMRSPSLERNAALPQPREDAAAVTAPIDFAAAKNYPVRLRVELDPGFATGAVESPYLPVTVERGPGTAFSIVPRKSALAKRRDFLLTWRPADPSVTYTSVFTEEVDGERYSLFLVHPQTPETMTGPRPARELVIVIDTSGSMQGTSIAQARQALLSALDRLDGKDTFNIIQFNSFTNSLFNRTLPATADNIGRARDYVRGLAADNGTEMYPALQLALSGARDPERLFQVIFITDGCVGNETELFSYIKQHVGDGRIFTVGIGSAPNHYFMRTAAQTGRGTFLYIGSENEVAAKMGTLFHKISAPVLTDISLSFANGSAEVLPDPVPDLYAGEPIFICARSNGDAGQLVVRAKAGDGVWVRSFAFTGNAPQSGIGKLWARRKIERLTNRLQEGRSADQVKKDVVPVALRHHLVSQYTSLVAVEHRVSRPQGAAAGSEKLPQALPEGWEMSPDLPKTGLDTWAYVAPGLALMLAAAVGIILLRGRKA